MSRNEPRTHGVPLVERTGFLSIKIGNLLLESIGSTLTEVGLTARTYFVLAGVDVERPRSQQDLSRLLGIDPTTMVALVDELEKAGFVSRTRNASDRRRYDLGLTPAGAKALTVANEAMDRAEAEFFGRLGDAELNRYHLLLRRILQDRWPPPLGQQPRD